MWASWFWTCGTGFGWKRVEGGHEGFRRWSLCGFHFTDTRSAFEVYAGIGLCSHKVHPRPLFTPHSPLPSPPEWGALRLPVPACLFVQTDAASVPQCCWCWCGGRGGRRTTLLCARPRVTLSAVILQISVSGGMTGGADCCCCCCAERIMWKREWKVPGSPWTHSSSPPPQSAASPPLFSPLSSTRLFCSHRQLHLGWGAELSLTFLRAAPATRTLFRQRR